MWEGIGCKEMERVRIGRRSSRGRPRRSLEEDIVSVAVESDDGS